MFLCRHRFSASLWNTKECNCWSCDKKSVFSFVKNCQLSFKVSSPICIPTVVIENSWSSAFLSAFSVVSGLDFGHSIKGIVASHCYLVLDFPDDIWCGASFQVLICHLYSFFSVVSIQVFSPYFNGCSGCEFSYSWVSFLLLFSSGVMDLIILYFRFFLALLMITLSILICLLKADVWE